VELDLYVKDEDRYKQLRIPLSILKDLLRDRLTTAELERIWRLAQPVAVETFKSGSVVLDFATKSATCYNAKINLEMLEPTWNVKNERLTLANY